MSSSVSQIGRAALMSKVRAVDKGRGEGEVHPLHGRSAQVKARIEELAGLSHQRAEAILVPSAAAVTAP